MKKDENRLENVTKYGEFVSSYFAWLSLDEQKEKADILNNMTRSPKTKVNNWDGSKN